MLQNKWTNIWGWGISKRSAIYATEFLSVVRQPSATILSLFCLSACCSLSFSFPPPELCVSLKWNPLGSRFYSAPPLFAVSRTQMRTLKCGLRYTGLTSWPCSVHHNPITRCTEPLKKICHLSRFAIYPLRLFLLLLLLTRWLPRHTQTVHSLLPDSSLEFKTVASSRYTIQSHFSRASIWLRSTIHISSLTGASNSLISSSIKSLTLGWCGLCHCAFYRCCIWDETPIFSERACKAGKHLKTTFPLHFFCLTV